MPIYTEKKKKRGVGSQLLNLLLDIHVNIVPEAIKQRSIDSKKRKKERKSGKPVPGFFIGYVMRSGPEAIKKRICKLQESEAIS